VNRKLFLAIIVVFSASLATLALTLRRAGEAAAFAAQEAPSAGPVLVELFTSEGCSSCPPADALLARLDGEKIVGGAPVIVLEEHVSYWDNLGWKDPFSSSQWTARQESYAEVFHDNGVYTPQMVVDGADELVGSREGQAREAIRVAAEKPKARIHLGSVPVSPGRYQLNIQVQMLPSAVEDSAQVWLAVTESGLHSRVLAGENSGEDLHHAPVVRSLQTVGTIKRSAGADFHAAHVVDMNPAWKRENVRFVVFVQEKKTLRVFGASAARPE
jgi:hypothetical protein